MTTLNTIIEEEKKEFDRRIDSENYETEEDGYGSLKTGSDTLLGERWYPESEYELDVEKVKDFLATAMQRAYEAGQSEERQFILNVLDGVDIADGYCNTKAIRFALDSRIIKNEDNLK